MKFGMILKEVVTKNFHLGIQLCVGRNSFGVCSEIDHIPGQAWDPMGHPISPRAPGSNFPHAAFRDAEGDRVNPFGEKVTRKSIENHFPISWDL
jgi:hypothetical protein